MGETSDVKARILATADKLGLTMKAKFVPWSLSRNAGEKQPSLNWKVTLSKGGRDFLTTDYMAGSGYCPSYRQGDRSIDQQETVRRECETGKRYDNSIPAGERAILPDLADVLHSLASDADAIDDTFEGWAANFGYDTDSRKAEAIYRACLETAIKLRAALGEDGMKELREAVQDY